MNARNLPQAPAVGNGESRPLVRQDTAPRIRTLPLAAQQEQTAIPSPLPALPAELSAANARLKPVTPDTPIPVQVPAETPAIRVGRGHKTPPLNTPEKPLAAPARLKPVPPAM